jgi:hypothetical protein
MSWTLFVAWPWGFSLLPSGAFLKQNGTWNSHPNPQLEIGLETLDFYNLNLSFLGLVIRFRMLA